jgi:aryl-alcohol dehydrogenase-like predicted oxidoreductase
MMNYAVLGKTGIQISRIGLGCMALRPGNDDNERIVHGSIDAGVNYFDTANIYDNGLNEEMLGKALKGKREQVIIASKVGNRIRLDGTGLDWDPSKEHIVSSIEDTLKRLGTDHLDLYQLHGGTISDPIEETIDAFEMLKRQGKIVHYGISSIRPNVIREWVKRSGMSSVMMQYSLLDRRPEEECFELLQRNDISVLVRGAVAQGLLVDKLAKGYAGRSIDQVQEAREVIHSYTTENRSAAQTAIQFVLLQHAVTSVIVGIRTIAQLREAVSVFDVPLLSEMEADEIKSKVGVSFYREHR